MKYYRIFLQILPYIICLAFFIAYSTLSIVRHAHYASFGYDLGINDQAVWRYSQFQLPLTTIAPFFDRTKFAEHIELVYIFLAPFYWIWNSPVMLLLLQNIIWCSSAIAAYLLARKYKLNVFVSCIIVIAYLMFYGVQFALWTDVHSSVFAAAFFMWFIYFIDIRKRYATIIFFILTLTAKESTGTALFFIALIYYFYRRERFLLIYMITSIVYLLFAFYIFFPYIMHIQYLYANDNGLLSNFNPITLIDTTEKQTTIYYSFFSWGFLPLLSPFFLLPILSHFYKYFVVASDLIAAHGLYGHYRIMIAPALAVATIWTLKKFSPKGQTILGLWLLLSTLLAQYMLHLPLSYLTKSWFWQEPVAAKDINTMISNYLPVGASVVAQNNIIPHISHRVRIYELFPEQKHFPENSVCGMPTCNWFRWYGVPEFLIVDTSSNWDIRHLLANRPDYIDGLKNLEKVKIISRYKVIGNTVLYKINKNPTDYSKGEK